MRLLTPDMKVLGICSHCVSVAESCKVLPQFIESFKRQIKHPAKLSKFAPAMMLKEREVSGLEKEKQQNLLKLQLKILAFSQQYTAIKVHDPSLFHKAI